MKNDQRLKPGVIAVVYFKYVTDFEVSSSACENCTEVYQEPKAIKMTDKTTFVCERLLSYGVGRILQTVHNIKNPVPTVESVRSAGELEKML